MRNTTQELTHPRRSSGLGPRSLCTCSYLHVGVTQQEAGRMTLHELQLTPAPRYLFGGVPPYIYGDIGGADRWIWFILANLLALAAVCPFVGSLSDLIGRRYVAIMGASFIVLGMIICSTAHTMNIFICVAPWRLTELGRKANEYRRDGFWGHWCRNQ